MSHTRDEKFRSGRGVGYCLNATCEGYTRGRVLAHPVDSFICPRCTWVGRSELERGVRSGDFDVVSEVRVEYAFDPVRGIYTRSAIVREERLLRPHAQYTLSSPLIDSAEAAHSVGRMVLARLNANAFAGRGIRVPRRGTVRTGSVPRF